MQFQVKRLHRNAVMPHKAHDTDSGFDLYTTERLEIPASSTGIAKTGIAVQLPPHHEMVIRPRSGISTKTPIRVIIGTIDSGYTGEIGIIVDNPTDYRMVIEAGTKLAQGVIQYVPDMEPVLVDELGETNRGSNGYGSTGGYAGENERTDD